MKFLQEVTALVIIAGLTQGLPLSSLSRSDLGLIQGRLSNDPELIQEPLRSYPESYKDNVQKADVYDYYDSKDSFVYKSINALILFFLQMQMLLIVRILFSKSP